MEVFGYDVLQLLTWENLIVILIGTMVGMFIGALPGLGIMVAIVLLFPMTYSMSPLASILLLLAAYQAAEYGGSISSIILGIPGTPAAAATILDGNVLARKGYAGKAIGYSLTSSTIGGLFGGLVLIFLAIPLTSLALKLSDPEFFLIGLLGLVAVAALSSRDMIKSSISVIMGLLAGTVGMDLFSGIPRFTADRMELMEGINLIALVVGVFALSEIFLLIGENLHTKFQTHSNARNDRLKFSEFNKTWKSTGVGSLIGSIVGIFPGLGSGPASWFAYSAAKKMSKNPDSFGTGNPDGITAPEAANNAVVGGALLPLLTLGIPGSPSIAIIMGAFLIHGIQPGPGIMAKHSDLVYSIFIGFLLTTLAMYFIGKWMTPLFAKILRISNYILIPILLLLSIIGVFAARSVFFDIWIAVAFGVIALFLKLLDYSLPSFVLSFVLSPIIEESLRRTLTISDGSYAIFITRPYSAVLLLITVAIMLAPLFKKFKAARSVA